MLRSHFRGSISLLAIGVIAIVAGYGYLAARLVWITHARDLARSELQVERNRLKAWEEAEKGWKAQLAEQAGEVARMRSEAARRAAVSAEALAAVNGRAQQAERRVSELLAVPAPQAGEDRCVAACRLLRSPLP